MSHGRICFSSIKQSYGQIQSINSPRCCFQKPTPHLYSLFSTLTAFHYVVCLFEGSLSFKIQSHQTFCPILQNAGILFQSLWLNRQMSKCPFPFNVLCQRFLRIIQSNTPQEVRVFANASASWKRIPNFMSQCCINYL